MLAKMIQLGKYVIEFEAFEMLKIVYIDKDLRFLKM